MTTQPRFFSGTNPGLFQGLLIVLASIWVFAPAFHGGWLWDDNVLITANPLMSDPTGLWKIWFEPKTSADYYPITFTVQRLEWSLWGNDTLGYHLVSLLLHIVSAFLVWRLLGKLGLRLAWLGGLVFAIHPVQVESVAWMAELKNTLSMPPILLALCAWIDYDSLGRRRDYFLALALFLIALLCKITVVMLPVVLLLHAWWRRGRIAGRDFKIAAPFFAVSLAIGLIPILTGSWNQSFNHLGPEFMPPGGVLGRFVLAGQEFAFYFGKSILPFSLMPVYPKWTVDPFSPIQFSPWFALAGLTFWFWIHRETWGRHALFGWFFFLVNLLPCPGFIPSPNMAYAWVMDHFLYFPLLGLIGLAVALAETLPLPRSAFDKICRVAFTILILAAFALGSRAYAKLYADPLRLWTYAVRHNPASWMVHMNLGEIFLQANQIPQAIEQFKIAAALFPRYIGVHYDLANALDRNGQLPEAIAQYDAVMQIDPTYHNVAYLLAMALVQANQIPEATAQLEQLLQQNPRHAAAHLALGNLYLKAGRLPEATDQFAQASAIDGSNGDLHYVLGNALLKANRLPEALDQYQHAARLSPRDLNVLGDLGVVLVRLGRIPEAAQQFELMLQIDPNSPAAHTNMGSLFLTVGKFPEAIAQYQEALRLNPGFAEAQQDLARAQALQQAHPH